MALDQVGGSERNTMSLRLVQVLPRLCRELPNIRLKVEVAVKKTELTQIREEAEALVPPLAMQYVL